MQFCAVALSLLLVAGVALGADIDGKWTGQYNSGMGEPMQMDFTFKPEGTTLTGTAPGGRRRRSPEVHPHPRKIIPHRHLPRKSPPHNLHDGDAPPIPSSSFRPPEERNVNHPHAIYSCVGVTERSSTSKMSVLFGSISPVCLSP